MRPGRKSPPATTPCSSLAAVAAAIVIWGGVAITPAPAAEVRILVSAEQAVTISGSSDSLRGLIEDLCEQAGVEVRDYAAPDRAITVSYEDMPLSELLPRLLRQEAYMVGLRGSEGGSARIAWLHVAGSNDGVAAAPPQSPAARTAAANLSRPASSSPGFIVEVFATEGAVARKALMDKAKKLLEEESEERNALLRADAKQLAERLADYGDARQTMVDLQAGRYPYVVRRKLGMLMNELNAALRARDQQR